MCRSQNKIEFIITEVRAPRTWQDTNTSALSGGSRVSYLGGSEAIERAVLATKFHPVLPQPEPTIETFCCLMRSSPVTSTATMDE